MGPRLGGFLLYDTPMVVFYTATLPGLSEETCVPQLPDTLLPVGLEVARMGTQAHLALMEGDGEEWAS